MKEIKKILCAEDEPDIQIVVQTIIEAMGNFEIKVCNNGQELLDCVEDYNPDLILLDLMMPKVDGMTAFSELQKNEKTKDIPVILMTAKAQIHEIEEFEKTGVLGIITKPFDPLKLCDEIQEIWQKQF